MGSTADNARAALITVVLTVGVVWAVPGGHELDTALGAPLASTLGRLGLNQSWAMFALPDTSPQRLEVHVHQGGGWVQVYDRWDAQAALQPVLRQRRVRGFYDTVDDEGSVAWWNFTRWVARQALLAHPEADRARIRMVRSHTTLPNEPVDPGTSVHLEQEHRRTAVLPEDDL